MLRFHAATSAGVPIKYSESVSKLSKSQCRYRSGMRARVKIREARSSIVHSQGTAHTIFESPACVGPASSGASVFFSGRATVFQPVPLQRGQSGRAIKRE